MRLSRLALVPAVAAASALALAGCSSSDEEAAPASSIAVDDDAAALVPEDVRDAGVVTVGTEAQYPPYEFVDPSDGETITGLDIDLLEAATAKLGLDYELQNVAFDTLLPSLDSERYDLVVAGITDSVERQANYDFVDYFSADQAIIVPAGNPEGISEMGDLCGLTVAVLVDTTQQALLEDANADACAGDEIDILTQQTDTEALTQVQGGRAAATLTQEAVGVYNAAQIQGGEAFSVANDGPISGEPLGFVFAKGDDELRDAFQAALQSLVEDGTYDEILSSWDVSLGALDEIVVNGAQ
ncbi:ABC transporter substrate-binding protein [Microbacterium sp. ZXX196]|uniref:ABC transporter substrate-binding protein n=1 Tax=Microbacterium sp. ZXX196 TaxID=2609291 RepID=UPI0012B9D541|nr:ABC transporter substrate-binding protein [Microbacterium sp. ZXX196]MTE23482.1 transporter substrate-binding domain-containing protein [Microbacterium sp. ZXX196]